VPSDGLASLPARIGKIRSVLDGILSGSTATMLDLKRRIAQELAIDPKPEALQALSAIRDISDPRGRELGSRAALVHLALDASLREVWDADETDPATLRRGLDLIPDLLALTAKAEAAFVQAIGTVDRVERQTISRLHASLRLPEQPLLAALVVVPEIERLAQAARSGSLGEVAPGLAPEEVNAIVAVSRVVPAGAARPDRAYVDAIALRVVIERDVAAWRSLPPEDGADEAGTAARRQLRSRLEAERTAHQVVSPRLDALRSERYAARRVPELTLDRARRSLFTAYVALSQALAGELSEAEEVVRERILEAEQAAAAVDAERAATQGLLRDATARADQPAAAVETLPPDAADLARERKRRKLLVAVAACLVPVALGANVIYYGGRRASRAPAPDFLSAAMPVQQVMPVGRALYSQVSTFLWEGMDATERRSKVDELGRLARGQGYQAIVLVDESRKELARWSVTSGAEIPEDRPATPR